MNRSNSSTSMHSLEELSMPIQIHNQQKELNFFTRIRVHWFDREKAQSYYLSISESRLRKFSSQTKCAQVNRRRKKFFLLDPIKFLITPFIIRFEKPSFFPEITCWSGSDIHRFSWSEDGPVSQHKRKDKIWIFWRKKRKNRLWFPVHDDKTDKKNC